MANSAEGTAQLLDQLQNEVNRVMEQMGRVFVAYNENPKVAPAVQFNKLTQILPAANDNFHEALDQLERELQLAKLVMRRDLAVCRERSGLAKAPQTNGTAALPDVSKQQADPTVTADVENESIAKTIEDVSMQDAQPGNDAEMTDAPAEGTTQEQKSSETTDTESKPADQADKPSSQPENTQTDPKASDPTLQIDTNAQTKPGTGENTQGEEDNPPDTGTFSNTNDLDSLFGGPTSAGPGDGGEFNMDPNSNTEFDFGSFGANLDDNSAENDDNITSLLPGLQDYANNQPSPGHPTDFDNIFDLDSVPIDAQQNENTFDDLLDFEDFTGGDYGGTEGNNNANAGDTDFSFSFD